MGKYMKAKLVACICVLTTLLSCGGVYATWIYAQESAESKAAYATVRLGLEEFSWSPAEVLPDKEEEGKSHIDLVNNLLENLNSSRSYLNQQITLRKLWRKDTVGSMGYDQREGFESLFQVESENLSFLIQFIKDDSGTEYYYIFTTDVDLGVDGAPNYPIGTIIYPIYKTVATKVNGTWVFQNSTKGYAESAYYEESNLSGNVTKIPSFDPDTWQSGEWTE